MTIQLELPPTLQAALNSERSPHPIPLGQRRREALWVKSHGLPHGQSAQLVGITENTLREYCQLSCEGGVDGLKAVASQGPVSALPAHYPSLEAYFRAQSSAPIKEAQPVLEGLTGSKRSESQVREFLKKNSLSAAAGSGCSPPRPTPPAKRPL